MSKSSSSDPTVPPLTFVQSLAHRTANNFTSFAIEMAKKTKPESMPWIRATLLSALNLVDAPVTTATGAAQTVTEEKQQETKATIIAEENARSNAEDQLFNQLHHFLEVVQMQTPPVEKPALMSNPPTVQEIQREEERQQRHLDAVAEWEKVHPERKSIQKAIKNILTHELKAGVPYVYDRQKDPAMKEMPGFACGAHIRSWWATHVTDGFADEESRPDLSWLKERHLARLRRTNLLVGANLTGFNLSGLDLLDINLSGANLSKAVMRDVDLSRVNIEKAIMHDTDLTGASAMPSNPFAEQIAGEALRQVLDSRHVQMNKGTIVEKAKLSAKEYDVPELDSVEVVKEYFKPPKTVKKPVLVADRKTEEKEYEFVELTPKAIAHPSHASSVVTRRRYSAPDVLAVREK